MSNDLIHPMIETAQDDYRELVATVGIPACGKSTWADEIYNTANNFTDIVERDTIRATHFSKDCDINNYKHTREREKLTTLESHRLIRQGLRRGHRVIVADTNTKEGDRITLAKIAEEEGAPCHFEWFNTPLWKCVKRNQLRHSTVPESVLLRMENRVRKAQGKYVKPVQGHWGKPRCIIVDIDGTLASHKGIRGPHQEDKVYLDDVRHEIVAIVNAKFEEYELWNSNNSGPDCQVIIFSGRHNTCILDTVAWLDDKAQVGYHQIEMRAADDDRNDSIIKEDLFDDHIRDKYNVEYVIDDRKQVCMMWESMGLNVINVGGFLSDF